jgi:outer membrane lipoprotein SlyB
MKKFLFMPSLFLCSLLMSVPSMASSFNTYQAAEVGVANNVVPGVIIAKRIVTIEDNSGIGTVAGAVAGGAGGSVIGGGTASHIAGAVGGAIVGGILGNVIDSGVNRRHGFEYFIRLRNGSTISVVQNLKVNYLLKQRVLVIYGMYGNGTRIIPDYNANQTYHIAKHAAKRSNAMKAPTEAIKVAFARNTAVNATRNIS